MQDVLEEIVLSSARDRVISHTPPPPSFKSILSAIAADVERLAFGELGDGFVDLLHDSVQIRDWREADGINARRAKRFRLHLCSDGLILVLGPF